MPQKNRYFWIIFQLVLFFQSCISNDTITHNQSFKDGDVLVSSGNTFAFGFFSPGKSLNLRYVGIWYNKIPEKTVVWVANRDNPINGNQGVLSIENSGNLVLRYQSNMVSWSTNVWGASNGKSYFVQLLETGNLVLCEGDKYGSKLLWESFDYPTNTILPHMKIGVNRTSGSEWSLTSWKSPDDPGTGDFVIKMDINGPPQVSLYKNSVRFWRSGPWNGIRWGGPPDKTSQFMSITVDYIENEDEVSTSYSFRDQTIICREFINELGLFDSQIWQEDQHKWIRFSAFPKDLECDYYGHCGSFSNCNRDRSSGEFECVCLPGYEPKVKSEWKLRDGHNGCTRKPGEPMCGNSTSVKAKAGFIKLPSVKVPDTRNAVSNASLGLKECADLCLKNCSCTAYATANVSSGGSGCITWYGDLMDMRQYSVMTSDYMTYSSYGAQDVYIKVSESQLGKYLKNLKDSDGKVVLIVALVPSTAGVLLLVFAICLVLWRRKGTRRSLRNMFSSNFDPVSSYGGIPRLEEIGKNGDFSVFDLRTIKSATNCFDFANKLGEGGFGSVYKGKLQDGREVAIKRLSKSSGQGIKEFKNEVTLIARLQHRNLVQLLGCCIQQEEKMLVYEHLPNKGLDNFIFDKEKGASLDWRKRHNIILGIARGILYLHRDSRLKIIHRDLKASNVLLDANMEPKISDFGMARKFNSDQVEGKTHRVVGTYGYMPPEYVMKGLFSEKSDVFSYGVLLLEIICGRRNNSFFGDNILNLTAYVWELWEEGNALDTVDPIMGNSYNPNEVLRCIHVGLLCVQEHARDRPTMSEVLSMLYNETSIPSASPKQPAFAITAVHRNRNNPPYSPSALREIVDVVTITIVEPR